MDIRQISIIGLGLMGGSFALALKNRGFKGTIVGYDISADCLDGALKAQAIDAAVNNLEEAVTDAKLVVIAIPISKYETVLEEIGGFLCPGCIVTDLGSVKVQALQIADGLLPEHVFFVGGHPMTGSESGGFKAADPFLYENAYYFLTPKRDTPVYAVEIVESMVKGLGAYTIHLPPDEHDLIVSRISHLPHVIAMILVNFIDKNKSISYLPFVGGGFRDTTRIASGNPDMWKDVLFANKKEIIKSIESFQLLLDEFKHCLECGNNEKVVQFLNNAKLIRDSIPYYRRDYISPLFEITVSIEDRPGTIAGLTQLISSNNINIKQIEILHSRQNEGGALRLAFESKEDRNLVLKILEQNEFHNIYCL
ncbi:MAG TPA: prephenate dehydrogenase [Oscillospiraceae bacterium]|nr:prephenate dehydrogenase [Oscillospiraceae bacterium]